MCLVFISIQNHPRYKLIIAGNRDEFYNRGTAAAGYWQDHANVLGGRDLEAGGTWLAVTQQGKIGLVTNYRDPQHIDPSAPSRGHLVSDYLTGIESPDVYLRKISTNGKKYNGFNLIVGDTDSLWYYSNYGRGIQQLGSGFYGLSNHLLETSWPKVLRGKEKIKPVLAMDVIDPETLFEILYDDQVADDIHLPQTGLAIERERALSSMFIKTEGYGSRCSTVILVDHDGQLLFSERVYNVKNFEYTTQTFQIPVHNPM